MQRPGCRCIARAVWSATASLPALPLSATTAATALAMARRFKACTGSQYGSAPSCGSSAAAEAEKPTVSHYSKLGMDGFTDVKYNTAADAFLDRLENAIDALEHQEVDEISSNGGVVTIETVHHGTYLINKQAPNMQLWLSSPISGPFHYDMVVINDKHGGEEEETTQWLSDQDGHSLVEKLETELSEVLKVAVKL